MKKIIPITTILLMLCSGMAAQERLRDSLLAEIESAYNGGQYLSAELEARRMLEQPGLSDSLRVPLEKWIAFSLIAQGKSSAAKDRFAALLQIDEHFELDPVLTSPKILSVFNEARVKHALWRKNTAADSSRSLMLHQTKEERTVTYRTIVFPGWEQLHHGRTGTGYFFLGAGIITLTSGAVCEVLRSNAREEYLNASILSDITSKYSTYNTYRKAEVYSFAAFAAVYLLSEVDVFANAGVSFEPVVSAQNVNFLKFSINF